ILTTRPASFTAVTGGDPIDPANLRRFAGRGLTHRDLEPQKAVFRAFALHFGRADSSQILRGADAGADSSQILRGAAAGADASQILRGGGVGVAGPPTMMEM